MSTDERSGREPATPADAFTELVLEVFRSNGRLLAAGDRLSAPLGLTSARWQVLGAIDREPLPVAQIARNMGLTRQSVQRTADVLAAEGVVAYAENPSHKRAKLVRLTPRGRAVLDAIDPLQAAWASRIAEGLSVGDLQAALALLRTIRRRLEDAETTGPGGEEGDGS